MGEKRKIEVLGNGCIKCRKLYENVCRAVAETATEAEVVAVNDPEQLARQQFLTLPGLVIDGEVKARGRTLSVEQIKKLL